MALSKVFSIDKGQSIQMTMREDEEVPLETSEAYTEQQSIASELSDDVFNTAHTITDSFFYSSSDNIASLELSDHFFDQPASDAIDVQTTPEKGILQENPAIAGKIETNDDEKFVKDLAAILQGQKSYQATYPPSTEEQVATDSGQNKNKEITLTPGEHSIFEKIAQSMKYANSYDLGSFNVAQRLDDFDREMTTPVESHEHIGTTPSPSQESVDIRDTLDEQALHEDLANIIQSPSGQNFNPAQPLSPDNGGKWIEPSELLPGDLIVYPSGTQLKSATFLQPGGLHSESGKINPASGVVFRHDHMSAEKAVQLSTWHSKNAPTTEDMKTTFLRLVPVQVWPVLCDRLDIVDQAQCRAFAGRIDLGLPGDEIQISKYTMQSFDAVGLNIATAKPDWTQTTILALVSNGTLKYAGHVRF